MKSGSVRANDVRFFLVVVARTSAHSGIHLVDRVSGRMISTSDSVKSPIQRVNVVRSGECNEEKQKEHGVREI